MASCMLFIYDAVMTDINYDMYTMILFTPGKFLPCFVFVIDYWVEIDIFLPYFTGKLIEEE